MKWDNKDDANKKKWVVKSKRPAGYQTLDGTAAEFRNFLNTQPDIKTIASELSGLVDLLLVTGNRGWGEYEPGECEHLDTWQFCIPPIRRIQKQLFVKMDLRKWVDQEVKKYKNWEYAWIYVSSTYSFFYQVGFCEEHAALACYLLIFGGLHPQSKPPLHIMGKDIEAGDPNRKIYFSIIGADLLSWDGPVASNHAFVVLVNGDEFAESIKKLKQQFSAKGKGGKEKVFLYMNEHPELWGKNAWVADGWNGYSYLVADIQKTLKTKVVGMGWHSNWNPFRFGYLFPRICDHYGISWD